MRLFALVFFLVAISSVSSLFAVDEEAAKQLQELKVKERKIDARIAELDAELEAKK